MDETRRLRVESEIQKYLSSSIRDLKDPRVLPLTITQIKLASDASFALIFVTLLGGVIGRQKEMADCLKGLESASGFLRRGLAPLLQLRHIPTLQFKEDAGIENVSRVHELLKQIEAEKKVNET